MDAVMKFLNAYGYIATILVFLTFIIGIINWFRGILPAIWRLGKGLACRKIGILAENDVFTSLRDLLLDSKLFKESNINQITNYDIQKAAQFNLLLAHWKSIEKHLNIILDKKHDHTALVIYAPQEEGFIDRDCVNSINQHRNVIIVNFRGRLLNDIVTCLITSANIKH